MAKYASYVICTSPRSGSTLLCKLLSNTGTAGNPESWFHRPSITSWLDYFELTPDSSMPEPDVLSTVFAAAIAKGSLDTGMFGLRLQQHSFDYFSQKLAVLHPELPSDGQRFNTAFGRTAFIHLTRLDKIEQAVSHVMAEQTGLWHRAPDGTELERLSPPQKTCYAPKDIQARVEELTVCDRQWENWFSTERLGPLRVTYEALAADPIETLKQILNFLHIDSSVANDVVPAVAKLADTTSQNWVTRFRSENPAD